MRNPCVSRPGSYLTAVIVISVKGGVECYSSVTSPSERLVEILGFLRATFKAEALKCKADNLVL